MPDMPAAYLRSPQLGYLRSRFSSTLPITSTLLITLASGQRRATIG